MINTPTQDVNYQIFVDSFVQKPIDNAGIASTFVSNSSYNFGYIFGLLIIIGLIIFVFLKVLKMHTK